MVIRAHFLNKVTWEPTEVGIGNLSKKGLEAEVYLFFLRHNIKSPGDLSGLDEAGSCS